MGPAYGRGLLAHLVFQIVGVLSLLDHQLPPLQRLLHLKDQVFGIDRLDEVAIGARANISMASFVSPAPSA